MLRISLVDEQTLASQGRPSFTEAVTSSVREDDLKDCLCGLVVRVPGYRSRGFVSGTGSTQPRENN
jgi:hypothetical protein